jgi:transcriptional regulator with XRE-family HTH domain
MRIAAAERGITHRALALRIGVPLRTLQRYLSAHSDPGSEVLAVFCRELRIDGDWLLTGGGGMTRGSPHLEQEAFRKIAAIVSEAVESDGTGADDDELASVALSEVLGAPDLPAVQTSIVGYLQARLLHYGQSRTAVEQAFADAEGRALSEREVGLIDEVEWYTWVAVREGAILGRAYQPHVRALADPFDGSVAQDLKA